MSANLSGAGRVDAASKVYDEIRRIRSEYNLDENLQPVGAKPKASAPPKPEFRQQPKPEPQPRAQRKAEQDTYSKSDASSAERIKRQAYLNSADAKKLKSEAYHFASRSVEGGGLGLSEVSAQQWANRWLDQMASAEDFAGYALRFEIASVFAGKKIEANGLGFQSGRAMAWALEQAHSNSLVRINDYQVKYVFALEFANRRPKDGGLGMALAEAAAWAQEQAQKYSLQEIRAVEQTFLKEAKARNSCSGFFKNLFSRT